MRIIILSNAHLSGDQFYNIFLWLLWHSAWNGNLLTTSNGDHPRITLVLSGEIPQSSLGGDVHCWQCRDQILDFNNLLK